MLQLYRSFVKKSLFFLFVFVSTVSGFAQNWELGVFAGGSYSYCDASNELIKENVRYSGFVFARKHLNESFSLRLNIGYIRIAGMDSLSKSEFQLQRNLNFFTDIYEISGQFEYHLVPDKPKSKKKEGKLIPYVFAGVGLIYFIPQTIHQGEKYDLALLQTSGIQYSQIVLTVPLGAGLRYYISPRIQLGMEMGLRITSSSDLDDIRGNSVYPDPINLPNDESRLVYDRSNHPIDAETGYRYGYPGKQRGKLSFVPDMYIAYGLTLSYKFGDVGTSKNLTKKRPCPRFY